MTFDDRLRDELRRATASAPIDTDAALDAVQAAEPGVARLEEVVARRPHRVRTQRLIGLAAAIAVVIGAVAIPLAARSHPGNRDDAIRRVDKPGKHLKLDPHALQAVVSALDATTNVGSFRVAYTMIEQPPTTPTTTGCAPLSVARRASNDAVEPVQPRCIATFAPHNVKTTGIAIVNVDPYALISVSNVSNFGDVTVRADNESVWEQGGANYGLESGSLSGSGQPLSGFAGLVQGTLGRREGAGAMMGLASPYGYLHVVQDAITGAQTVGSSTVNGEPVTVYRLSIDPARLAALPNLSDEQRTAINAAIGVLHAEGLTGNTTEVSVDAQGFVVRTLSVNLFSDGGSVTGDNTLSAFGCAGAIQMPNRAVTPTSVPPTCANGSPPPTLPTTTTTTVSPSGHPASVLVAPSRG